MNFSEIIKNAREKKGLTLREACSEIGVSLAFLHRAENNRYAKISYDVMQNMARLYNLNFEDLVLAKKEIPFDVYRKLLNNPELITLIRQYDVGGI